jgi:hypothetical protein
VAQAFDLAGKSHWFVFRVDCRQTGSNPRRLLLGNCLNCRKIAVTLKTGSKRVNAWFRQQYGQPSMEDKPTLARQRKKIECQKD